MQGVGTDFLWTIGGMHMLHLLRKLLDEMCNPFVYSGGFLR